MPKFGVGDFGSSAGFSSFGFCCDCSGSFTTAGGGCATFVFWASGGWASVDWVCLGDVEGMTFSSTSPNVSANVASVFCTPLNTVPLGFSVLGFVLLWGAPLGSV